MTPDYFRLGVSAEDVSGRWPVEAEGLIACQPEINKPDYWYRTDWYPSIPNEIEYKPSSYPQEEIKGNATFPAPEQGNPKDLIGAKKPDLSLVPPAGLLYESQAMMDGAAKYGPYNWRSNPVKMRVYIAAAMRHLQQLLDGEDFDPKSGVHHIGHARACMGILADARETGNLLDDRPLPGPAGDMVRRFEDNQSFKTATELTVE